MNQPISPCLWFDEQANKAGKFYCSHFKDAKIIAQSPVVTEIEVSGQRITLLDGGPKFKPNSSISLFYICETAEEIDQIWSAFAENGNILQPLGTYDWSEKYGWIEDQYGISWQFSLDKLENVGQKITPCLTFFGEQYGRAQEAMEFYSSIFHNTKLDGMLHYKGDESAGQEGKLKHGQLEMNGQKFMFMDSNEPTDNTFNEGVSLTVHCESQEEIDYYWEKLTMSGEESMCGWLKDKFGVSWQIIPNVLADIMSDPNKAGKAARAFMDMRKLDIEKIVQASLS